MIPKLIHLCWLSGDPYPSKIEACISTWKKFLPDYKIMIWDTKSFDVNSTKWTKEAFESKKFAFVADYIRFYAVYNYGGIYLDSDVQVLKSFNSLLHLPYFIGLESNYTDLEVAVFGAEKGQKWVYDCLQSYKDKSFIMDNGKFNDEVCPKVMRRVLFDSGKYSFEKIDELTEYFDNNKLYVLPQNWFCAHIGIKGAGGYYTVSDETFSIHHFAHSWAEFPGGILHRLYYRITGKDWKEHYFKFHLYQE